MKKIWEIIRRLPGLRYVHVSTVEPTSVQNTETVSGGHCKMSRFSSQPCGQREIQRLLRTALGKRVDRKNAALAKTTVSAA